MQPLSATDAIGVAFNHTRAVLAPAPFRLGWFFKLALLAALTQTTFLSVSFSYPLQGGAALTSGSLHGSRQLFAGDGMGAFAGALGLGALLVIFGLALLFILGYLYLFCRARAALFDLVVFRGSHVREAWRRRQKPGRRYFGLVLLTMLLFWCMVAAVVGPVFWRFVHMSVAMGGANNPGPAVGSMLTLVGLVWLLLPLWIAADALLQDFVLPGLALDPQAQVIAAFARLGRAFRRSPGQLLLYLLLRTIVAFGIGLALGLATLVFVGLVALSGYGVGRLLYHALWSGGLAGHTVFFAYVAGAGLLVASLYLFCMTAVFGITGTFKTSYAAYFYAGYYPELAAALGGHSPEDGLLIGAVLPHSPPPLPSRKAEADLPAELW